MRLFVLVMLLLVIVYGVVFYTLNTDVSVQSVSYWWGAQRDVPLYVIVFISFFCGVLWALVIFIVQEIRLRVKMSRLKNTIKRLREEIDTLRTMPLKDIQTTEEEE